MGRKLIAVQNINELGGLVKKIRKAQRVTQVQLSQLTNLGSRFVVDFESGKPTLQIGKALEVLKTLGIKLYAEVYEEVKDA